MTTTPTPGDIRYITASKIPAILGLSKWESPAQLWMRMRGELDPKESTPALRRGVNQEASILDWYFTEMRPGYEKVSGETILQREDIPWASAAPDAIARDTGTGELITVDAKSVARDMGMWGKPGTDEAPLSYVFQVQWQMHMTHGFMGDQIRRGVLVKHGPFVDQWDEYIINYDPALCAKVEKIAYRFYESLKDSDACPAPSATAGEAAAFAKQHPDINKNEDWQINPELAKAFVAAREAEKEAQGEIERTKAEILRAMGKARNAKVGDLLIARRQPTRKGVSLYPSQRQVTIQEIEQATFKPLGGE